MKRNQQQILLYLLCIMQGAECARRSFRKSKEDVPQSEKNKVLYIFVAFFLGCGCLCCIYICNRLCPQGTIFSDLELDDIRISRVQDTENSLQHQIESLQTRLTLQRMKRTHLETSRDVAASVEERVESFNAKGQQIYGDAWEGKDGGTIPIKELITIPEDELRQMRVEAQNIVTARKAEEERDLWKIWNQFKEDPGAIKKNSEGGSMLNSQTSGASSATGQPDVLTGRTSRITKTTGAVKDPRFSSAQIGMAASTSGISEGAVAVGKPITAIPPPRAYAATPSTAAPRQAPRPPPPGIRNGPGRGLGVPRRPSWNDEKADDRDDRIHSSFHSPPPRSNSEFAPLLTASESNNSSSSIRPPPPSGPPPGWKGPSGKASARLAPLVTKGTRSPLSPPLAPEGVLPPRGTPPPAALKRSSRNV